MTRKTLAQKLMAKIHSRNRRLKTHIIGDINEMYTLCGRDYQSEKLHCVLVPPSNYPLCITCKKVYNGTKHR